MEDREFKTFDTVRMNCNADYMMEHGIRQGWPGRVMRVTGKFVEVYFGASIIGVHANDIDLVN